MEIAGYAAKFMDTSGDFEVRGEFGEYAEELSDMRLNTCICVRITYSQGPNSDPLK